ncbi:MAG: histidine kinase, partial [Saprospiraceae bacterium]|nr:histidine kinase [Saprospiraceae bacterium]
MTLFRSFPAVLAWRIALLTGVIAAAAWSVAQEKYWLTLLLAGAVLYAAVSLHRYVNDTNRRLARFFESVRYSDFAIRFSSAREKGDSFTEVNRQFNEVLEAFRQTRAEK